MRECRPARITISSGRPGTRVQENRASERTADYYPIVPTGQTFRTNTFPAAGAQKARGSPSLRLPGGTECPPFAWSLSGRPLSDARWRYSFVAYLTNDMTPPTASTTVCHLPVERNPHRTMANAAPTQVAPRIARVMTSGTTETSVRTSCDSVS